MRRLRGALLRHHNKMLRIAVQKYGRSWKNGLYVANWCLNTMPRIGTTISPFRAFLGFQPKAPADGSTQDDGGDFESLRFQRKELSPLELVKQLDWHRKFCMDVLETERKRNIEASLLNAEQVCYTRSFNVGDLCLVATHKLCKKEDDTAIPLHCNHVTHMYLVWSVSCSVAPHVNVICCQHTNRHGEHLRDGSSVAWHGLVC